MKKSMYQPHTQIILKQEQKKLMRLVGLIAICAKIQQEKEAHELFVIGPLYFFF